MTGLKLIFILLTLTHCGDEEDRQEVLSKLRGLGVSSFPLTTMASTPSINRTVELTIYAALPKDTTATFVPFKDLPTNFAVTLEPEQIAIVPGSESYKAFHGFQILTFKAIAKVPMHFVFEKLRSSGAGQVRYGFLLTSPGEEERIVGNFLIFKEGAQELTWENPQISSIDPKQISKNKLNLNGNVENLNNEALKISWFTSAGKITNRNAKETTWSGPSGDQTFIFAAHGRTSRGFAIETINIISQ